jgi:hypothetical protein
MVAAQLARWQPTIVVVLVRESNRSVRLGVRGGVETA